MKDKIIGNYRLLIEYLRPKINSCKDSLRRFTSLTLRYIWRAIVIITIYELYKLYI